LVGFRKKIQHVCKGASRFIRDKSSNVDVYPGMCTLFTTNIEIRKKLSLVDTNRVDALNVNGRQVIRLESSMLDAIMRRDGIGDIPSIDGVFYLQRLRVF